MISNNSFIPNIQNLRSCFFFLYFENISDFQLARARGGVCVCVSYDKIPARIFQFITDRKPHTEEHVLANPKIRHTSSGRISYVHLKFALDARKQSLHAACSLYIHSRLYILDQVPKIFEPSKVDGSYKPNIGTRIQTTGIHENNEILFIHALGASTYSYLSKTRSCKYATEFRLNIHMYSYSYAVSNPRPNREAAHRKS